jgi:hypothetical protein
MGTYERNKKGERKEGGGRGIIKLIHLHLTIRAHSINPQLFPGHMVLVLMYF